jgi:hypothetical protein
MHPKWQALQSEFGITCDMSMENTSKSLGSSHKCHIYAWEIPIWLLNILSIKGNLQQNALLFPLVWPFNNFSLNNFSDTGVSIGLTKTKWLLVIRPLTSRYKLSLTMRSLCLISHVFKGWVGEIINTLCWMSQTLGEIGGGSVLFFWSNKFPKEDKKKTDPKFLKFPIILPPPPFFWGACCHSSVYWIMF